MDGWYVYASTFIRLEYDTDQAVFYAWLVG